MYVRYQTVILGYVVLIYIMKKTSSISELNAVIKPIIKKISAKQALLIILLCELINLGYYLSYFYRHHFLPAPFVMDKNDTFMDFYSPLFWVIKGTFYTTFNSVYPALNFFILKIFSLGIDVNKASNPFELRNQLPYLGWLVTGIYSLIILIVVNLGEWRKVRVASKIWIFFACLLTVPVLFGFERGNLIFWALLFLAFYLQSSNVWIKALFFGLLVNIKPYFVILLLQYININNFNKKQLIISILLSIGIFTFFGILANIDLLRFFKSYFIFSKNTTLSPEGVISLPHSLLSLTYIRGFIFVDGCIRFTFLGLCSTYSFWFSILKIASYFLTIFLIVIAIVKPLSKLELLIACIFLVTNFSVSTGGYILIIYLALIPYLINSREYRYFIYPILAILVIPIDWIKLIGVDFPTRVSYLGGDTLENVTTWISLGSIVRPLLNFSIMVFFIHHVIKKYPFRKSRLLGK